MAIWQYALIVVPKVSIKGDYECIFENNKTSFLPKTESLWKSANLNISELTLEIDKLIKRESWSSETYIGWKSKIEDNDCHIAIKDGTNQISEFIFRIDLREPKNISVFLKGMLKICDKNEFVLFNLKGKILNPQIEIVIEDIKLSSATAFLMDPGKYLDSLK